MLMNLPLGLICGLKVQRLEEAFAVVSIRFSWINKNPFRSIYFAALAMAAELSTGLLAFGQAYQRNPSLSMLVIKLEAVFLKKAVGEIRFTCHDGMAIANAMEQAIATGESVTLECVTLGINAANEQVAQFVFTWSFKTKTIS